PVGLVGLAGGAVRGRLRADGGSRRLRPRSARPLQSPLFRGSTALSAGGAADRGGVGGRRQQRPGASVPRRRGRALMASGILVDKPAGVTSHDVVARCRRALGTRRIGHAGTLDPLATGLLVLGVDGATRLLTYLVGLDKTYEATIRLGVSTDSDDADGEITATTDASHVTPSAIASGVEALTGRISQVPSTVSAIKVGGRRAYDLARAGEQV